MVRALNLKNHPECFSALRTPNCFYGVVIIKGLAPLSSKEVKFVDSTQSWNPSLMLWKKKTNMRIGTCRQLSQDPKWHFLEHLWSWQFNGFIQVSTHVFTSSVHGNCISEMEETWLSLFSVLKQQSFLLIFERSI